MILVFRFIKLNSNTFLFFCLFFVDSTLPQNGAWVFKKLRIFTSTLTNGLFLIHPTILYLSYTLSFLTITKRNNKYFFKKSAIKNCSVASLYSLILGSWWAQQELNWNGWWGWDFIEVLGLINFLVTLKLLHLSVSKIISKKFSLYLQTTVFILVISSRVGVANSIHAFLTTSVLENFFFFLIFGFGFFSFFKKKKELVTNLVH